MKNHNICKHDKQIVIDAVRTFIFFIVSFLLAFILEGIYTSFPKLAEQRFSTKELFLAFPYLHSKMFISALPSFFAHQKSTTELLTIACLVCACLFSFKTVTTPGAGLTLAFAVSTKFYDVASIPILSGAESKFFGVLSVPILLLLVLLGRLFNF